MELIPFMEEALHEAELAYSENEVPVGAVLVRNSEVIARAHNTCLQTKDPTAHAEMLVIREGIKKSESLADCTLFVTLEPCAMCAGAPLNARIGMIVFGAFEPRTGACGSVCDLTDHFFVQSCLTVGGIMERECASLLTRFFEERREKETKS